MEKVIKKYSFQEVNTCEMCGENTEKHRVMGQRLNQSQGFSPRKKTGISVSIKKCSNCKLIYSSPLPIPNNIQDHYGIPPETYWKPSYFEWEPSYFIKQIADAKELIDFKDGMKALDVGAGLGKSMLSMQNSGFEAFGFEPSIPFYERAISKMKIDPTKIKLGAIEEVEYEQEIFDFITFGAVYEHLYHPFLSLEKAMKWLKSDGVIQIEVPSSKHLIAKLINTYFRIIGTSYVTNLSPMHSPFHLYEFGLKSFEEAGKKIGFKVVKSEYEVCDINPIPKFLHIPFRKYMEMTDSGMQLTVYLKKLKLN